MIECINRVEEYRASRNFEVPEIDTYILTDAGPKGIPDNRYLFSISVIEWIFKSIKLIDSYIYSIKSSHQSHTESNAIASSLLRSPYIEKIKCTLNAPYPQTYFSPATHKESDAIYNTYQPLTERSADLLKELIGKVYGEKNPATGILGADAFLISLRYYGLACGYRYAQPFRVTRLVFQLENKLL